MADSADMAIHRAAPALRRFGLAALAPLLALALAGCDSRPQALARVGDQEITVQDFLDAARNAESQYPNHPDSAKHMLLDDLVRRTLILQVAIERGYDEDDQAQAFRAEVETGLLIEALLDADAPQRVPVSDAEIRRLYEWRGAETQLQMIYAVNRTIAEAAMKELRGGAEFAAVADRFNPSDMIPPGGKLGFLQAGTLVSPLDRVLRESPVGELVGPLEAPGEGFFILKVLERRPREQPPFTDERTSLVNMLRQRKHRRLSLRLFRELKEKYRVAVLPDGPHALFARFNDPGFGTPGFQPPPPTPEQSAMPVARYDGGLGYAGAYTYGDALRDLDAGKTDPPNPSMLQSFKEWIEAQVIKRVAVLEARRRHLHEEPATARRIDQLVNNSVVNSVYEADVARAVRVTDEDIHQVYRRRAGAYAALHSATVQHLTIPDSSGAEKVLAHARRSKSLADAILHSSPGLQVRETEVHYPTGDPVWATLRALLVETEPGEYGGPRRVQGGWMVFQVVAKDQETPPLESLGEEVWSSVNGEATELARERRLASYCDSLRQVYPVSEHRELLARIPWPAPRTGSPTGWAPFGHPE